MTQKTTPTSAELDVQIAELRRRKRAALRAEQAAEKQRFQDQTHALGACLVEIANATTITDIQALRAGLNADRVRDYLRRCVDGSRGQDTPPPGDVGQPPATDGGEHYEHYL